MASKTKRARILESSKKDTYKRNLILIAVAIFITKIGIAFNIEFNYKEILGIHRGAWVGADGENYVYGLKALWEHGFFAEEFRLNYWPAGYPILLLIFSLTQYSWIFMVASIVQSALYSTAVVFILFQISRTRLKKLTYPLAICFFLNPTLSLSSLVIGYESLLASGFLMVLGLITQDLLVRNPKIFKKNLFISASIFGVMSFVQPRMLLVGILVLSIWAFARNVRKTASVFVVLSLLIMAVLPTVLIVRNLGAGFGPSISTNLGTTMAIGSGDDATGAYGPEHKPCSLKKKDSAKVVCSIKWYVTHPIKDVKLGWNKSLYFWSPWYGIVGTGTMSRNPWLLINPVVAYSKTANGYKNVVGLPGKLVSYSWMLVCLIFLGLGIKKLHQLGGVERLLGKISLSIVAVNWLISLVTIGDHRFRLPILPVSIFIQTIGFFTLFKYFSLAKSGPGVEVIKISTASAGGISE